MLILANKIDGYTGNSGFYCWVEPTLSSKLELAMRFSWLPGFNLSKLHTTIVYSPERAPKDFPIDTGMSIGKAYTAEFFNNSLVLRIVSIDLDMLCSKWLSLGTKPTYTRYLPHMSLTSTKRGASMEDLKCVQEQLAIQPITIIFSGEQFSDAEVN